MPSVMIKETEVFTFDELSDSAKEKARDWWKSQGLDCEWWECVDEQYKTACKLFGLDISRIMFSGFWSQGDGASFTGAYSYRKGALQALKKEFPQWAEIHDICKRLTQMQKPNFYGVNVDISQNGRYCHEMTMSFNISVYIEGQGERYDIPQRLEEEVEEIFRDLARDIYKSLEAEYDYLTSDEQVDEMILCNEYQFTEDGEIYF